MKNLIALLMMTSLLAACGGGGGGGSSGGTSPAPAPEAKQEQAVVYPRTFTGNFRVQDNANAQFISGSSYSSNDENSLLGCEENADGREFTFTFRNGGANPDDLKITVKNAYFRENKTVYRDLADVRLEGYTRNKWFQFDASQSMQIFYGCEAQVERVKNYATGFFQCRYVKGNNSSRMIDFVAHFTCDIVQRK